MHLVVAAEYAVDDDQEWGVQGDDGFFSPRRAEDGMMAR
jgi:hypothetical protein